MKLAASIFSWIGYGIETIGLMVLLIIGRPVQYYYKSVSYVDYETWPIWVWFLFLLIIFGLLAISLWREFAVSEGHNIACGICTLLFVSLIGGILTLCLSQENLRIENLNEILKHYDKNLRDGEITQEEYDEKIKKLSQPTVKINFVKEIPIKKLKVGEGQKVELLIKYKKLMDDGIITSEDFNKKKEQLLL